MGRVVGCVGDRVEARVRIVRHDVLQRRHMLVDGAHERVAALVRQRRDLEHRALPLQALHEVL
jgi:hypothetical protein